MTLIKRKSPKRPLSKKRWLQILAWVHAELPRNRRQVWPYDVCDAAEAPPNWAPRTAFEKMEGELLNEILRADREETIASVLEKYGTTLDRVLHLTTDQIQIAKTWAQYLDDLQTGRKKPKAMWMGPGQQISIYAWKFNIMRRDRETRENAAKLNQRDKDLRDMAVEGGKARAHYKHDVVKKAFADFKSRNHERTVWEAANALIRKGQPLDKYKRITGLWNLVNRIAENESLSVYDWYAFTTHADG